MPEMCPDHWVYVARDKRHAVLYVGITGCGMSRFRGHRRDSAWSKDAASIWVQHYETREEAAHQEQKLIKKLNPRFNVTGAPKKRKPPSTVSAGKLALPVVAEWLQLPPGAVRNLCGVKRGGIEVEPEPLRDLLKMKELPQDLFDATERQFPPEAA